MAWIYPSIYKSLIRTAIADKLLGMTDTTSTTLMRHSPSLIRRLVAILYDLLLVIALVGIVNGIALAIYVKALGSPEHVLPTAIAQLLSVASVFGFFAVFWLKSGQTLGMQAWRIKLVAFDGTKPTLTQALLRCLGACVSIACLGIGYLWCLVDKQNRYWHDYLSSTELELLPKDSRTHTDKVAGPN